MVSVVLFLKSYCGVHSKRRDVGENSPRKTPTSTPKKGTELTNEEKSAEKCRRLVRHSILDVLLLVQINFVLYCWMLYGGYMVVICRCYNTSLNSLNTVDIINRFILKVEQKII